MLECKISNNSMHPRCILEKDEVTAKVEEKVYKCMIGSLLYLVASRPEILFSVCLCARFQLDPRESHLIIIKRIFRYLKGIINIGLCYRKSKDYKIVGYYDVDYDGDRLERKKHFWKLSISGRQLDPMVQQETLNNSIINY